MSALGYVYETLPDLPAWFRRLTPGQLQDIVKLMAAWHSPPNRASSPGVRIEEFAELPTLQAIERAAIFRAMQLCRGDARKAAAALGIGKTTIYRRLREWGVETKTIAQASALAACETECVPPSWFGTQSADE